MNTALKTGVRRSAPPGEFHRDPLGEDACDPRPAPAAARLGLKFWGTLALFTVLTPAAWLFLLGRGHHVRDDAGRFEIAFPGGYSIPEEESKLVFEGGVPVAVHTHTASRWFGKGSCSVIWFDIPGRELTNTSDALQEVQEGLVEGIAEASKSSPRITSTRERTVRNLRVRTVEIEFTLQGRTLRGRIDCLIHEGRVYSIVLLGNQGELESEKAKNFFESFRILGGK